MRCSRIAGCTIVHAMTSKRLNRSSKPRISPKMIKAIYALESGEAKDQRSAAIRCGVSESALSRCLAKPSTQAFLAERRAKNVALGALRASSRLKDLVDSQSEHVSFRAAERLLETTGDLRMSNGPSVSITNTIGMNIAPGYVIDLSAPDDLVLPGQSQGVIEHKKTADPIGIPSRRPADSMSGESE